MKKFTINIVGEGEREAIITDLKHIIRMLEEPATELTDCITAVDKSVSTLIRVVK